MKLVKCVVVALALSSVLGGVRAASACFSAPGFTIIRNATVLAPFPNVQMRLVLGVDEPWTTFAENMGDRCGCAFQFRISDVASVDDVEILHTGTNTPIANLGTGWVPSFILSANVPFSAGVNNAWFGFIRTLGAGGVAGGIGADIQLDLTLQPNVSAAHFIGRLQNRNVYIDDVGPTDMPLDIEKCHGGPNDGALCTAESECPGTANCRPVRDITSIAQVPGSRSVTNCERRVAKESATFTKASMKALAKCELARVKGKHTDTCPDAGAPTRSFAQTAAAAIARAAVNLETKIGKFCGGGDGICNGSGKEIGGAFLGWPPTCPNFEGGTCTNAIGGTSGTTCQGMAQCFECIAGEAIAQATALSYPVTPANPDTQPDINACQQGIGKAAAAFFLAKAKTLQTCWDKRLNDQHDSICIPPATGDGKYQNSIAKAEAKKIAAICKACGAVGDKTPVDGQCDSPGTAFDPQTQIGFGATCPSLILPYPPNTDCSTLDDVDGTTNLIDSLRELIACVDCVSEFKVDCIVAVQVSGVAAYPAVCQ